MSEVKTVEDWAKVKVPPRLTGLPMAVWITGKNSQQDGDLLPEEWRTIADFPAYEVSSWGYVRRRVAGLTRRSPAGKFLGPALVNGYLFVGLSPGKGRKKLRKIHQLVCEAFHGPRPSPKHEAAHNDGDPQNNYFGNLRWATKRSNNLDRWRHGTMVSGARNGRAKLTEAEVNEIRRLCDAGALSGAAVARKFSVSDYTVRRIKQRRSWVSTGEPEIDAVRVKVDDSWASIAVRPVPREVVPGSLRAADVALVIQWIELNRDVILDYWNEVIDFDEVSPRLRRLP